MSVHTATVISTVLSPVVLATYFVCGYAWLKRRERKGN